jgi:hypothetical protein
MSRFPAVQRIGSSVVLAGQVDCPVCLVASCLAGCPWWNDRENDRCQLLSAEGMWLRTTPTRSVTIPRRRPAMLAVPTTPKQVSRRRALHAATTTTFGRRPGWERRWPAMLAWAPAMLGIAAARLPWRRSFGGHKSCSPASSTNYFVAIYQQPKQGLNKCLSAEVGRRAEHGVSPKVSRK